MVTDKLTLSLLSRLADAQLALATNMRGVTPTIQGYPEQALQQIAQALEAVEAALVEIGELKDASNTSPFIKLH
ncbi:hypothetical protein D3C80_1661680 [compost metagenome]